ncbi:MAG: type II secretion system protein [Thermosipho sp. (in: Bacteria)]|nr:type II secretion system protein [Thermosipho sp. (in: thermotogales)]
MKMRKGFTLIELLIVLAIIAALMAVVTPIALNAVKKAKATQVAENFRNIKAAVESYFNVEEEAPSALGDLVSNGYLNTTPDGFELWGATSLGNGVYSIDIVYTQSDVDDTQLENVYSEIDTTSSNVYFINVQLQQWW